ncbi:hypothetical protein BDW02DRAFT_11279 [Decorospora gaudefroyi]|uniref:Uncharacterized protein n=1 Tax=Decorospora gaudefroyi TaxID=184978 RepID=A0A6A5KQD1_9PLEO|nr:hypothetical protein BDW02DRAFT_11279 [Decorospora gaudefroyi]
MCAAGQKLKPCCTSYPACTSLVWPWGTRQLVKRTAHFHAHHRVPCAPRCGIATASGTGAYSNFLDARFANMASISSMPRLQRSQRNSNGAVQAVNRSCQHRGGNHGDQQDASRRPGGTQERGGMMNNAWGSYGSNGIHGTHFQAHNKENIIVIIKNGAIRLSQHAAMAEKNSPSAICSVAVAKARLLIPQKGLVTSRQACNIKHGNKPRNEPWATSSQSTDY